MVSSVYIAKNVYGGDGLGRLGDSRVIFVPGAWAGELVKAELTEEKKNFVRGSLVEVVDPSPDRIEPSSPVMPGMVYANLSYAAEVKAKQNQLSEFFERGRLPFNLVPSEITCGPVENYRNKVVYHFEKKAGNVKIGYQKESSHEIVDIESDTLARKEINAALPSIRKTLTTLLTTGPKNIQQDIERKSTLTVRWSKKSGVKWYLGKPEDVATMKETALNLDFEVPFGGFYQINPDVAEALFKDIVREFETSQADKIIDLYCGVGVIGLIVAKKTNASLLGVESGRRAIEFAKRNAESLKIKNSRFIANDVGRVLSSIKADENTVVVVDPPRGGLEKRVAIHLSRSNAAKIFYVSCDPATLMRDLRILSVSYEVESVRWFNMFPRTARFETFVVLKRK
jgi:tRNA/tmRNA/rRNA uracil-C5-methylase (TrmA/RlmC/RlmD family)